MATVIAPDILEPVSHDDNSQDTMAEPRRNWTLSFVEMLRNNRKAAIGVTLLFIFGLVAIIGPWIAPYPYGPTAVGPNFDWTPSWSHWLGTTQLGQDVFSQLLAGTRPSIVDSVVAGAIATVISCVFGLTAGYMRGAIDDVLSLVINVVLILPTLPLLIVITAYASSFNLRGSLTTTLVIAFTAWPWGARVLRSQMLSLREKDFVFAARVAGESWWRIIVDEILPNMTSLVVANFIGAALYALLFSVALQFLGLTDESDVSWGTMLYWAQNGDALLLGYWNWFVPVGLCIALFGTGLAFTNYAIDEFSNPRLRSQRPARQKKSATTKNMQVETAVHRTSGGASTA